MGASFRHGVDRGTGTGSAWHASDQIALHRGYTSTHGELLGIAHATLHANRRSANADTFLDVIPIEGCRVDCHGLEDFVHLLGDIDVDDRVAAAAIHKLIDWKLNTMWGMGFNDSGQTREANAIHDDFRGLTM